MPPRCARMPDGEDERLNSPSFFRAGRPCIEAASNWHALPPSGLQCPESLDPGARSATARRTAKELHGAIAPGDCTSYTLSAREPGGGNPEASERARHALRRPEIAPRQVRNLRDDQ